jgi:nucleoside-triphosphatase THEP1
MKPAKIIILTGAKQSGKSTRLLQWSEHKSIGGFLTPIVSGKRMWFSLPQKEYAPFESVQSNDQTISIGRYHLLTSTFDQMNTHLKNQSNNLFDWLIIDEVGPLELKGEGIYPGLTHLLNDSSVPLVLVVREGLVQQVIDKFKLTNVEIISKEYLI